MHFIRTSNPLSEHQKSNSSMCNLEQLLDLNPSLVIYNTIFYRMNSSFVQYMHKTFVK